VSADPGSSGEAQDPAAEVRRDGGTAIPLTEEKLLIGKRVVETGRLRVSVKTETAEELIRETLRSRHAEVERVALGHEVQEVPQTRQEGDVLIVPIVEEILVIEKRLVLKEEIRLRFVESEDAVEYPVQRRIERAVVERLPQETATSITGVAEKSNTLQGDEE
jgi:stress response protein YsnF